MEDADAIEPNALPPFLEAITSLGDGHIIILTTRHFQQLSDALKDPGLVNQAIEFQLADKNRIALLFRITFPDSEEEDREAFTNKMPELYLSLAEIQVHLINSRSPKASIRDAEQWLASVKDERESLRRGSGHTWV
ncbi:ATP-dependent chaperone [Verticillium dahliae VdLs.17]|uniref:ATP-dependent chaperone n=1 Tax=Verticillium dahliae (strain VdLs.17 / ATCC MYA-4575 / FGSC 10137) TaxID=498257 RepID=G2WXU4_VERDV|nr:ATP-dependent chaperone [Verticillium dahliae VdLs.17]EGY20902.1 ATP-dependent chaperone [Verticillium dahliae VdLs.17]